MGNMSYCRFHNTRLDLIDCSEHMDDNDCKEIAESYSDDEEC